MDYTKFLPPPISGGDRHVETDPINISWGRVLRDAFYIAFMYYSVRVMSGDLIREARLRAGLTQCELGERLGKAQSVIARWERGDATPSLETLREVVRACGLELLILHVAF